MAKRLEEVIEDLTRILDAKGNVEVKISEILDGNNSGVLIDDKYIVAVGETKLGRNKHFPTAKQVYMLNVIYKVTGLICEDITKDGVSDFITKKCTSFR